MKYSPLGRAVCSACKEIKEKVLLIHIEAESHAVLAGLCSDCLEKLTTVCYNQNEPHSPYSMSWSNFMYMGVVGVTEEWNPDGTKRSVWRIEG